jgi:hypothetical protein
MPETVTQSSPLPMLAQHQLPGFGLPLNFIPHDKWNDHTYSSQTISVRPAQGDGGPLYPNALYREMGYV